MKPPFGIGNILSHTRRVPAGSPPLYRILLLTSLISSLMQAYQREAPVSVTSAITVWWGDWIFIGAQMLASLMVLGGLYLIDENRYHATRLNDSLNLELIGLCFMQTVIAVNVMTVWIYYNEPPIAQGTWFQIGFWFWCWWRLRDIRVAINELTHKETGE